MAAYEVTSVEGLLNTNATMLLAPGGYLGNNNLLYAAAPFVDYGGLSLSAGGIDSGHVHRSNLVVPVADPRWHWVRAVRVRQETATLAAADCRAAIHGVSLLRDERSFSGGHWCGHRARAVVCRAGRMVSEFIQWVEIGF